MRRSCLSTPGFFRVRVMLVLIFFLLTSLPVFGFDNPDELLIGIEPEHNIFDQMKRHRYLADFLSKELDVKIKLTIVSRYGEVIERFRALDLDGAFLTSYTATMGIHELNLEPLVNPVNLRGESTSQGYILVRKDSEIKTVEDMRGSTVVFVDPATMEGYLFPLAFLNRHGVTDIKSFFSRSSFSGSHESAILAVLDGRADVGAAKSTVFDKLVASDQFIEQELDILAFSPKAPEITLCLKNEFDPDFQVKLKTVLLSMDSTLQGKKVLKQFNAQRFVKSNKTDFTVINDLARDARNTLEDQGQ